MKKRIIILIMLILFSLILVLSIIFFKNKTNDIEPFAENIIENAKEEKKEKEEKEEKEEKQINNITKIIYGESAQGRPLEAFLIKGEEDSTKTIFLDFEVHRL